MRKSGILFSVTVAAVAVAACSEASEEAVQEKVTAEEATVAEAQSEPDFQAAETWEVCDENGNSYPSEADAEAAGLDRAEYGATFCE